MMPRIRSLHPSQWSDEDFVALSFPGRLLALALRNEADDQGIFEWKPLSIKMRLFPADAVDVDALLKELEAHKHIQRFDREGRAYGAIRNFRRFQRPKKPSNVYVLPHELRTYVGLSADSSEPVPHMFGSGGENPPQMEDGGGMMDEEEVSPPSPQSKFDEFWEAYPRHRRQAKPKCSEKFRQIVKSGHATPEDLIEGAKRYSAAGYATSKFAAAPLTWLNQGRWTDVDIGPPGDAEPETPNRNVGPGKVPIQDSSPEAVEAAKARNAHAARKHRLESVAKYGSHMDKLDAIQELNEMGYDFDGIKAKRRDEAA